MHIFDELKAWFDFSNDWWRSLRKALEEGQVLYYVWLRSNQAAAHLSYLSQSDKSSFANQQVTNLMRLLAVRCGLIGDPSFKDAERSLQTKRHSRVAGSSLS